jgi:hypothetical protein
MPKVLIARMTQVALGHDAEGAGGGQPATVLAVQLVAVIAVEDDLSFESARQVKTLQEDITGIVLPWIGVASARVLSSVANVVGRLTVGRWSASEFNPVHLEIAVTVVAFACVVDVVAVTPIVVTVTRIEAVIEHTLLPSENASTRAREAPEWR